jgi:hypothetical protein
LGVENPSGYDMSLSLEVSLSHMGKIEERRLSLEKDDANEFIKLSRIKPKYDDSLEYVQIYNSIIVKEARYEKEFCKHISISDVKIEFTRVDIEDKNGDNDANVNSRKVYGSAGKRITGKFSLSGRESGMVLNRA